jgi:hypothetical protein
MRYPTLSDLKTSREWLDVFKGYNHNLRIGEGEFYDMKNLSSDNYPILSPRPKRGIYASPKAPQGMIAKDALCYVDGSDFVINEYHIPMGLATDRDENGKTIPKSLISMGAYVIIMPDKKYINTEKYEDKGDIESIFVSSATVTFELCKLDGSSYENVQKQATAPTITDEMKNDPSLIPLWLDTSSVPNSLKVYSVAQDSWTAIATTYVKITASDTYGTGVGKYFSENDGVSIAGVENASLSDLNASMTIMAKGDDYIIVTGIIDQVVAQEAAISVSRRMPNMDFVIESGNRLWGCRYGVSINGDIVNEIYACKLGDFKNWNCFMGISSDSYVASLGSDGQFTGAITHLGYPIFFKENCMHKVYGNYPANFQIQTTTCRGVQKGCSRSLATVNEVLYYKARSGICAYDGSLPVEMSSALGDVIYNNAVAGAIGNKYYISMSDAEDRYHLFVYDTLKGMWHKEDNTEALCFCNCRGDLYYIDHSSNQIQIKTVRGTGVTEATPTKWEAVTGIIGTNSPDKKYLSRMDVRMSLEVGARASFYAEYDSSGEWVHLFTMDGVNLKTFPVSIKPKRCDHMRLKITGTGDAKIFSICKTIEQGSDT